MQVFILLFLLFNFIPANDFQITIGNIKDLKGTVYVAIYNETGDFPEDHEWELRYYENVESSQVIFSIPDMEQNKAYAIAVYQDLNNNGIMDKNKLGIPKEPFGFSNNVRPKFSAPKFEACKIIPADSKSIDIELIHKLSF